MVSDQGSGGQQHFRTTWPVAALSLCGLLLIILGLYRETALYLAGLWSDWAVGEYAHGYLVLAISLYLVFRQREALAVLKPCPSGLALLGVAAASLLWLAAALVDVLMVQSAALLLLIMAVIWVALGNQVARRLLFPVMFIGFAIPLWSPLSAQLQGITADVVFWLTRVLGVPALRQEHVIVLPAGQLFIEEACSGLRYLLAGLTLGVLYAYLNYQRMPARVLVILVAAGAAIMANILRVLIVVYLAYKTDMQHPLIEDHLSLGWYLFGGVVFVLLFIDLWLSRYGTDAGTVDRHPEIVAETCRQGYLRRIHVLLAAAVLIASAPGMARWGPGLPLQTGEVRLEFPTGMDGWSGPLVSRDSWMPVFHNAHADKRAYLKDGNELQLYVGYYPVQGQGSELINALNRISDVNSWHPVYPQARVREAGVTSVLEQELISASGQRRLVWFWYRVAGWNTTNRYAAKGLQVLGRVTRRPQASVFAIAVDMQGDLDDVQGVLREFLAAMVQPITYMVDGENWKLE